LTWLGILRWKFWFEVSCPRFCSMSNPRRNRALIIRWTTIHIYSFFWEGRHLRTIFLGLFIIK
jgi:hypothetical protein